jgi:hypothetical protein
MQLRQSWRLTLPCNGGYCTRVLWNNTRTATVYRSPAPAVIATPNGVDGAKGYTASVSIACVASALPAQRG